MQKLYLFWQNMAGKNATVQKASCRIQPTAASCAIQPTADIGMKFEIREPAEDYQLLFKL